MYIIVDTENKNPLTGIFLRIGMFHIIQNVALKYEENHILKRDTTVVNELLILVRIPVESLHRIQTNTYVCRLSSSEYGLGG